MGQKDKFNNSGKAKVFGFQPHSEKDNAYHLVKKDDITREKHAVGEYVVLSAHEDKQVSERKVGNLVHLLNNDDLNLIGEVTGDITFFQKLNEDDDEDTSGSGSGGGFVMRNLEKEGVSKLNAQIWLDEDTLYDKVAKRIGDFCRSISTTHDYRSQSLYGHVNSGPLAPNPAR